MKLTHGGIHWRFFVSLTKGNKRWVPLKKGILTTSMTSGFSRNAMLYGISYVTCFEESCKQSISRLRFRLYNPNAKEEEEGGGGGVTEYSLFYL